MDAGIIVPWRVGTLENPLPVIRKLAKGYWPEALQRDGKVVGLTLRAPRPDDWDEIGAYAIEGLSSIAALIMQDLRRHLRKLGQDPVGSFTEANETLGVGDDNFCAPSQAHYNFTQFEMHDFVTALGMLPVSRVFLSALEAESEEQDTRDPIRGPEVVGKKATPKAPAWVGDCIHYETFVKKITATVDGKPSITHETEVRAYFTRHADPRFENISYPAKPRVPVEHLADLLKEFPGGFYWPGLKADGGLDRYLEVEERILASTAEESKAWRAEQDRLRAERMKAVTK